MIAMGLLVYHRTHSKEMLGWIGFAGGIPNTLLMLFGGVIADRTNKKRLVLITQSIFGINALILAILTWTNTIEISHIILLSLVNGVTFALDGPARQSMLYNIVGKDDLSAGIALQSAAFNIARIFGPIIGTQMYGQLGAGTCFFVNALSFVAVIIAIMVIKADLSTIGEFDGSVWLGLMEGIHHFRSNLEMKCVVAMTAITSLTAFSVYSTLMPAFATERLGIPEGDSRYGLLFMAIGSGALVGAFMVGRFAAAKKSGVLMFGGAITFGISLIFLAFVQNLIVALVLFLVIGIAAVAQLATANSLTQNLAPEALRGRAVSTHMFAMAGIQPFGSLIAGRSAEHFGISFALWSGAAILLMFSLGLAFVRPTVVRLS